jgi:uncharacterized protein
MKAAILEQGGEFTLFGGEALLVPKADLEDLWAWGLERNGANNVQTNGSMIDDDHITLFKKYRVSVGISIDGPGELNDVRWAGTLERTRETTARTEAAIARLCAEGIPPSLIITLHRGNAAADRLDRMCAWFTHLERIGIRSARLHLLEVEDEVVRQKYALTEEENLTALLRFYALELSLRRLRFDTFKEMRDMLLGWDESTSCVWHACDPYTTRAVRGVEGDGRSSNCGRTNKDGIDFVKSTEEGFERYVALYQTPQDDGGCAGCRFFLMCKGQCPGTAVGSDWRNRTEHCGLLKRQFRIMEQQHLARGILPLSLSPDRLEVEEAMIRAWLAGQNPSVASITRNVRDSVAKG